MAPSPIESEHAGLLVHTRSLIAALSGLEGRIESGNVTYEQHRVYAQRASALVEQLSAALALAANNYYGPAFCLLRPALEQAIFDRLLCLGTQYVQTMSDVSEETFSRWKVERDAGAEWARNVMKMERNDNGVVRLQLRGISSRDPGADDISISIYFFLLQEFRPLVPPAKDLPFLLPQSRRDEHEVAYAKTQHEMYHASLRWPALIRNLRLNDLASDVDIRRITVHYRFLSAFVHPLKDHYRDLYGRSSELTPSVRYDHFSSELFLLYAIRFATFELETWFRASERAPRFAISDGATLKTEIAEAKAQTSYLWFIGDEPHIFDRIQESNRRYWSQPLEARGAPEDPRQFGASGVRYYQDPLSRMVALHVTTNEMDGYSFASSWPRSDAWPR